MATATHFLNVDLDIYSRRDLGALVERLGKKVHVLFAGREGRRYCAHLEIVGEATTPDSTIRMFCRLIESLPVAERSLWDAATVRSFSIGIQAGTVPNPCDFRVHAETLRRAAELGAQIVFTVYPYEQTGFGEVSGA